MPEYQVPEDCFYTKDHEWVRPAGEIAVMGVTDYAQKTLGEIVFVETPSVESTVNQGDSCGYVESPKAVSDIYAPVSGVVLEANAALAEHPEWINQAPYGDGWLAKITLADATELDSLMKSEAYRELLVSLAEEEE